MISGFIRKKSNKVGAGNPCQRPSSFVFFGHLWRWLGCQTFIVLPNEIPSKIPHGDSGRLELCGSSLGRFDYALFAIHEESEGRHLFGGFLAESVHESVDCVGDFRCHIGNS
jgi:hypothetical protein